ncbi:MAG: hypothetical protein AB9900_10945 [Humidesulfovibrio sp.]
MAREITAETAAAAQAEVVRLVALARFDFDTGTLRCTSAPYDMLWDELDTGEPETFITTLGLGKISGVEEGAEQQAYSVTVSMSGIQAESVSLVLSENPQGRPAWIWAAFLDEQHRIIPDPVLVFAGRMDTLALDYGDSSEVALTIESRLADWGRTRGGRYTDAEQQSRCPGDRFFEFVAQATDKELTWGKA